VKNVWILRYNPDITPKTHVGIVLFFRKYPETSKPYVSIVRIILKNPIMTAITKTSYINPKNPVKIVIIIGINTEAVQPNVIIVMRKNSKKRTDPYVWIVIVFRKIQETPKPYVCIVLIIKLYYPNHLTYVWIVLFLGK